jgi:hypothetical protein
MENEEFENFGDFEEPGDVGRINGDKGSTLPHA